MRDDHQLILGFFMRSLLLNLPSCPFSSTGSKRGLETVKKWELFSDLVVGRRFLCFSLRPQMDVQPVHVSHVCKFVMENLIGTTTNLCIQPWVGNPLATHIPPELAMANRRRRLALRLWRLPRLDRMAGHFGSPLLAPRLRRAVRTDPLWFPDGFIGGFLSDLTFWNVKLGLLIWQCSTWCWWLVYTHGGFLQPGNSDV